MSLAAVLFLAPAPAPGAEQWVLLPEASFMGHKVTRPIEGARRTVLAVARWTPEGPEFPAQAVWNAVEMSEAELTAAAARQAAAWLREVEPVLERDARKVLRHAVLRSEKVPVAATVLAREFWERFEPLFGARMRVVIPNRNTVFIFPDVAGDLRDYAPLVLDAWRDRWPRVSLEVFTVEHGALRAAGAFAEP